MSTRTEEQRQAAAARRRAQRQAEREEQRLLEARYDQAASDAEGALSERQVRAAELLADGKAPADIADAIGVDRRTVVAWRDKHPAVRVVMNRRRAAAWDEAVDRIRALLPKVVERLGKELEKPDGEGVKVALVLLKLMDLDRSNLTHSGARDVSTLLARDNKDIVRAYSDRIDYRQGVALYMIETEGLHDVDPPGDTMEHAPARRNGHIPTEAAADIA